MAEVKGFDVSSWNPNVDFKAAKAAGMKFVNVRVVAGTKLDSIFKSNIEKATAAGLYVGVYCYSLAKTKAAAIAEAKRLLAAIEPYKITYPVFFDIEDERLTDLGKDKLTDICLAFLDTIKKAGYYAMLYSNPNWLTYLLDYDKLKEYSVWLAQYASKYTWKGGEVAIWQYGTKKVAWNNNEDTDMNIAYVSLAKFIRDHNFNNLKPITVSASTTSTNIYEIEQKKAALEKLGLEVSITKS